METEERKRKKAGLTYPDKFGMWKMIIKPEEWKSQVPNTENIMEERVLGVETILSGAERHLFLEEGEESGCFSLANERKRETIRKNINLHTENDWQEAEKIAARAVEILSDWEEAEDIRMQIQYGALIVGKLENLKKKEGISSDEIRKKICTLLKNTIRLNISEGRFSKEQVQLIQEGFSMIVAEQVQKEDMLQLNRKLRNEGLQTMPAWE